MSVDKKLHGCDYTQGLGMSFFAARQPILDIDKQLYGYELLFRKGYDNIYPDICNEAATSRMINGLTIDSGINDFASGNVAFINFTESSLINRYHFLLPHDKIVVEILETVTPSPSTLDICLELKAAGFTLALDDYEDHIAWNPFLEIVDIIKVDIQAMSKTALFAVVEKLKDYPNLVLLAEKIETYDEFQAAKQLGFTLFQGYFFSKPVIIKSLSLDPSHVTIMKLMQLVNAQEPDLQAIADIIKYDANLSIKTLRYVQSPIFKRTAVINSIQQAIVTMGMENVKRLISLLFCSQLSGNKPTELSRIAIQRAYFCEKICLLLRQPQLADDAFLIGLLSLVDAMLDGDIQEIVASLPINEQVKMGLIQKDSWASIMLTICGSFERGNWDAVQRLCTAQNIDFFVAEEIFMRAQEYSTSQIQATT